MTTNTTPAGAAMQEPLWSNERIANAFMKVANPDGEGGWWQCWNTANHSDTQPTGERSE